MSAEGLKSGVRKSAIAGLVLLFPVLAVVLLTLWVYRALSDFLGIEAVMLTGFPLADQAFTFLLVLVLVGGVVVFSGYVARSFVGKRLETVVDGVFDKLPLLGRVYKLAKTASADVFEEDRFKKPVRVDVGGVVRPGFKTGNKTADGNEVVFVPASPNIASGFVMEVDPERIEEADETVDEILEKLLSAGFAGYEKEKRRE